ncbi:hypothetical protein E8E12_004161 [Didymella heteroderae]|uniref:N-acetyltransferase domain-containing protein n=1 Tax=Didymella heteroderae TaxID=1769908 RepID=A0A9P4WHJ0_9PLEO|nr:hypothetical protein E8E12_004161 [Didymella heteroderae]
MSTLPVPPPTISTPRLHLTRLTDPTPGSQHVQWFHENWSDPIATGWRYRPNIPHPSHYCLQTWPISMLLALKHQSLHGATKTLEESRLWMMQHLAKYDNWFYAVFLRDGEASDGLGQHIGSVSLRHMAEGPELLPPATFSGAEEVGKGEPLSSEEVLEREAYWASKVLNLRVLGYALFGSAHGKGYATEACKGLLDGYKESVEKWKGSVEGRKDSGKTAFYVEAGVDQENPGSQRVLRKVGFRTVGLKIEKEKAWLNGAWRGPGWWITGMYV